MSLWFKGGLYAGRGSITGTTAISIIIPPIIDSLSACSDPENSTLLRELQPALLARALVRLEECDLSRSRLTGHHYTALFSQIVEVK